ncbi:hypothetical protein D1007_51030 [Hordeum vulgare]|nr:hypothetical protein D1007_51030 [Hordeum vulgare]
MPQKGGKCGGSWGPTVPAARWAALERSAVVNLEGLKKVWLVVASDSNELGATQIWPGTWPRRKRVSPAVPLHFHTLLLGVLPPFSGFLNRVLSYYQIHVLHFDPRSLVLLSAFAFLCEASVGVTPSVALLRHFFSLELISKVQCSGCASLRIVNALDHGTPCVELLLEVERFWWQRVHVEAAGAGDMFQPPPSPATPNRGWEREELSDPRLAPVLIRLGKLRRAGVSKAMVHLEASAEKALTLAEEKSRGLLGQAASDIFSHLLRLDPDFDFASVLDLVPETIRAALVEWLEVHVEDLVSRLAPEGRGMGFDDDASS